MAKSNFIALFFIIIINNISFGQTKYFIQFKDKAGTQYNINSPQNFLSQRSLDRRIRQNISIVDNDLPVSKLYLDSIKSLGINVLYSSKWMNGFLATLTNTELNMVSNLGFVINNQVLARTETTEMIEYQADKLGTNQTSQTQFDFNSQLNMICLDQMHSQNIKGQGVLIGVLDSGFPGVDQASVFDSLNLQNRIVFTYDFVNRERNVYNDHFHGTNVLSILAANQPNKLIGSAPKSYYALFVTEDVSSETKIEEVNWLLAAEIADSIGVDVINTSLGYIDFDNSSLNYSYSDMDGKTSIISKAAEFAFQKGILVVASAGNYGATSWKYISTPGDGTNVITVGSVNPFQQYVSSSGKGPSFDQRVKPDVVATGSGTFLATPNNSIITGSGTSFATPLITGLVAGLIQKYPNLNINLIKTAIQKSGSNYNTPDNFIGYGIPCYQNTFLNIDQQLYPEKYKGLEFYPTLLDNSFNHFYINDNNKSTFFEIKIFDQLGKLVLKSQFQTQYGGVEFPLNINLLTKGVYQVILINSEKTILKRIARL